MTNETAVKFVNFCRSKLSRPVLMGAKGNADYLGVHVPEVYDCSGLVTSAIYDCTGVDMRFTHNAQRLSDETVSTLSKELGDLAFYGADWSHVTHVAVWTGLDEVISASGASYRRPTLVEALLNKASVRTERINYHGQFLGVKCNKWIGNK